MEVLKTGHSYQLKNLKDRGVTSFNFYMDPEIHNGESMVGPSTQEVLRMCIERVSSLNKERPHWVNSEIVKHLRSSLILFEVRALERMIEKNEKVETIPTNKKGHIFNDKAD